MQKTPLKPSDGNSRWQRYSHWLYTIILPVYLIAFFTEQHFINGTAPYHVSYMPLDDLIPFCEWFYLAYVLWYPMLGAIGLYLGFTDPKGFKRYMIYIGVSFLSAVALFILFPNGQNLRPDLATLGRENFCTRAIALLYRADPNTNVCPSLHVVGSLAVVFAVFHNERLRKTRWIPVFTVLISALICASTVLIKQHSLIDVLVGIPYALVFYFLIFWLPVLWHRRKERSKGNSL